MTSQGLSNGPHLILGTLAQVSPQFLGELRTWLEQNPPVILAAAVQGLPPVVTGQVNAGGSIGGGSGFTVNHSGTGVYAITFTPPFAASPLVKVTFAADQLMLAPVVSAESGSTATVKAYDSTGTAANCAFGFEARPTS